MILQDNVDITDPSDGQLEIEQTDTGTDNIPARTEAFRKNEEGSTETRLVVV